MSEPIRIDINCDMGESYGRFQVGNDQALMPYISSCNIACGFHGGDPYTIEKTIDLALQHNISIGAHPSYPDLMGFGRRYMLIPEHELSSIIKYQVSALKSLVESKGAKLSHVKPHGALYNRMAVDPREATTVINAIKAMDSDLPVMILSSSVAQTIAVELNRPFIAEAFIDRAYESATGLAPRSLPNAVLHDPKVAFKQLEGIVINQRLKLYDNTYVSIKAQSYCIHGDNPKALDILREIEQQLFANNAFVKKSVK